jgi:hypothetical protein
MMQLRINMGEGVIRNVAVTEADTPGGILSSMGLPPRTRLHYGRLYLAVAKPLGNRVPDGTVLNALAPRVKLGFASRSEQKSAVALEKGQITKSRAYPHLHEQTQSVVMDEGRMTREVVCEAVGGLRDRLVGNVQRRPDQSEDDFVAELTLAATSVALAKKAAVADARTAAAATKKRTREEDKMQKADEGKQKKMYAKAAVAETKKRKAADTRAQKVEERNAAAAESEGRMFLALRRGAKTDVDEEAHTEDAKEVVVTARLPVLYPPGVVFARAAEEEPSTAEDGAVQKEGARTTKDAEDEAAQKEEADAEDEAAQKAKKAEDEAAQNAKKAEDEAAQKALPLLTPGVTHHGSDALRSLGITADLMNMAKEKREKREKAAAEREDRHEKRETKKERKAERKAERADARADAREAYEGGGE